MCRRMWHIRKKPTPNKSATAGIGTTPNSRPKQQMDNDIGKLHTCRIRWKNTHNYNSRSNKTNNHNNSSSSSNNNNNNNNNTAQEERGNRKTKRVMQLFLHTVSIPE